ncbi:Transcription initiation factor IIF subunit beta [Smittium mucronatum]|uniref:Transcription initiation factor IIF subunit beta n=1 Tax=Smittium mucronatum TaxID=133383 RepID=A0A1R0GNB8_9FUNG|nr:Transcription initiation factor IIF subunit beta [Smittium mucronatum]
MDSENEEGPEILENDTFTRQGEYEKEEGLGEMDDEVEELDMSELDTKVWLVKIPDFLAQRWKQVEVPGTEIGTVRIFNSADDSGSNISLLLQDNKLNESVPKEYNLKVINNEVKNMYVFSEDRDPNVEIKPTSSQAFKNVSTSLTGTIHHECTVTPKLDENYQEIMRRRIFDSTNSVRSVQVLGSTHKNSNMFSPGLASKSFMINNRRKALLANSERKMERIPRNELIDLLFGAFGKFAYWTLKGLIEYTKQPSAFLKEVLSDIAVLNKRGPYSSMYSLKPEFRGDSSIPENSADQGTSNSDANGGNDSPKNPGDQYNQAPENAEEEDDDFEDVE